MPTIFFFRKVFEPVIKLFDWKCLCHLKNTYAYILFIYRSRKKMPCLTGN